MLDPEILKRILRQAEELESVPAGVNMTIRHMAKELAGIFYEESCTYSPEMAAVSPLYSKVRTEAFRRAYPTFKHYMRGQQVQPDGSVKLDKPGWLHHVRLAHKVLSTMLHEKSNVHSHLKWPIYEAIIEYNERANRPGAKKLHQAGFEAELQ